MNQIYLEWWQFLAVFQKKKNIFINRVRSLAREELTPRLSLVVLSQHIIVCVNGYEKRSVMSYVQLKKTVKKIPMH